MKSTTNGRGELSPGEGAVAGEIVATRLFDWPQATVYRAFMDPEVLARWLGAAGFPNTFEEFDPRPGGA